MDVNHHGPFAAVAQARRPHVQVQAVFTDGALLWRKVISMPWTQTTVNSRLWCARAKAGCFANAGPGSGRHRRHESPLRSVGAVRNALKNEKPSQDGAEHGAISGLSLRHDAHLW